MQKNNQFQEVPKQMMGALYLLSAMRSALCALLFALCAMPSALRALP